MAGGKTAKVFISSTSEDLKEFREAASKATIAAGMLPVMMEYFAASGGRPPPAACLAKVSETDLLVVIVAHRYGWVPPGQPEGQHKSITWLECDQAVADGKEVLAFLVDEKHRWPETGREAYRIMEAVQNGSATEGLLAEVNRNVALLKDFKAWLNGRGIRATFTTPEDLRRCVPERKAERAQRDFVAGGQGAAVPARRRCRRRRIGETERLAAEWRCRAKELAAPRTASPHGYASITTAPPRTPPRPSPFAVGLDG